MDKKLLIVEVAGLSDEIALDGLTFHQTRSVFPAVTCTVQASFRTASPPSRHGMVANGFFLRDLKKPVFWEQSSGLVQGARIWEGFRRQGGRVALLFWQQSLGEKVDFLLSPAPIHKHNGGMIQGCYSLPEDLYQGLCRRIGRPFKLRQYWGPLASWKAGEWIAEATKTMIEDPELAPDLCLTYLPTLDYDLQRRNPGIDPACHSVRKRLEQHLASLLEAARRQAYEVLVFGDYRIAPVEGAVLPNLAFRRADLMKDRTVKGMSYPDFYTSRAFAVVDHEVAHVYVSDHQDIPVVQRVLEDLAGIGEILDRKAMERVGLNHGNSGELVIVAEDGKWLAYPWWTRESEAPDFASHVDIHNKPGYDPCELFFGWPPGSVSRDTTRIRGSHGRVGPGRDVTWASTLSIPGETRDIIELAASVRCWLEEGVS